MFPPLGTSEGTDGATVELMVKLPVQSPVVLLPVMSAHGTVPLPLPVPV
jgi:hypothetical protein